MKLSRVVGGWNASDEGKWMDRCGKELRGLIYENRTLGEQEIYDNN
jgi:hypothetical protein